MWDGWYTLFSVNHSDSSQSKWKLWVHVQYVKGVASAFLWVRSTDIWCRIVVNYLSILKEANLNLAHIHDCQISRTSKLTRWLLSTCAHSYFNQLLPDVAKKFFLFFVFCAQCPCDVTWATFIQAYLFFFFFLSDISFCCAGVLPFKVHNNLAEHHQRIKCHAH